MVTELGALSSSSSDAESTPYDGYRQLGDDVDVNGAKEQEQPEEDEAEHVAWPAPTMPLSAKFLPRGTPTSVLAEPPALGDCESNDASFSSRFHEIDFEEVRRVASGIKLGKKKQPQP